MNAKLSPIKNDLFTLPPATSNLAEAKRHLTEFGVARIGEVLTPEEVSEARTRLLEQAEAERERGCSEHDSAADSTTPNSGPNQRVRNLINKGEIFRQMALKQRTLEVVRFLLGKNALLSSCSANIACRHGVQKNFHTDQFYVGPMPFVMASAIVWMLDDFTAENGATLVVPGSHRWLSVADVNQAAMASPIPATGPAGSVVIMDGRTLHSTGENHTDQPRHGVITYYGKPFMRQEENFALSLSPEVMQKCSRELLELLGFQTWFGLGGVDGSRHTSPLTSRPTTFSGEWRPRRLGEHG